MMIYVVWRILASAVTAASRLRASRMGKYKPNHWKVSSLLFVWCPKLTLAPGWVSQPWTTTCDLFFTMGSEDPQASLIRALHAKRSVTVNFFRCVAFRGADLWSHCQSFDSQFHHWKSNLNFLILVAVAATTIFIWDYILSFRMEVELVWKSRWSFMKGLYFLQCYLPFIDTAFTVFCRQSGFFFLSPRFCFLFRRSNGGKFDEDCWNLYYLRGGS
jgi:hypothetical protein